MSFYNTLNDALESAGLLHTWDTSNPPIGYNETFGYTFDNGTKYGYYVSIYRNENGKYETPVHYLCHLSLIKDSIKDSIMSPMLKRINQDTTMHTDDLLISIACGTILAALTMSFFI